MNSVITIILASAAVCFHAWPCPLWSQTGQERHVARDKIEALIAQLRSTNKDPNPDFRPFVRFPDDYDRAAQTKVEKAREQLIDLHKDAFPVLIEHLSDKAYSRSGYTAILRSFSVGDVCFMIIKEQVDLADRAYKSREGADGKYHVQPDYFSRYCGDVWYSQEGVKKWWKEHEKRSLREMQIEALEWTIERERAIGFPREKDREEYLNPLLAKLNQLKK